MTLSIDTKRFGRAQRRHWLLDDDATFLNHGSFGACPKAVFEAQDALRRHIESRPDQFFEHEVTPGDGATTIRNAAARLAAFAGADAADCALAENATTGIEAVLRSAPLKSGDEILITSHQYNAVRLAVERRCAETGARPRLVDLPIPLDTAEVPARIAEAASGNVALAIIDHITSPTALVLPMAEIVAALHDRGVPVLADGAHAIGQLDIDLSAIGADWYVTNAHKWLYAPRGTALLHCSPRAPFRPFPPVTSHFGFLGFPRVFDYVGTRDYSGWAAVPAAIDFFEALGPDALRAYCRELVSHGSERLARIGAIPVGPDASPAMMRSFILPQRRAATLDDALALRRTLWDRDRIQLYCAAFEQRLLIRVSAQAYIGHEDFDALADTLERSGWPGR